MCIRIVLASLLVSLALVEVSSTKLSLEALCKGEKVELRTIEQLDALVDELSSTGVECSDTIKGALKALKELTGSFNVCTMEKAQAVTRFVDDYLKDAPDGTKRNLPKPLERFAVAYGMKVSGVCSHRMMRELPLKTGLPINKAWTDNVDEFNRQISNESPLSLVLDPLIKAGEVIMPVDLLQAIPGMSGQVHLLIPKKLGLLRMKHICEKVFQPIYEPLLLPLAHLIRAGFNNREYYWAWKYHFKSRRWSRAVFLCELAKKIEYDPEQKAAIMKDEESSIETKVHGLGMGKMSVYEKNWGKLKVPPVKTRPKSTGNTIYGRFDYSMKSLVKAFDANKDHVQRLRERILKRAFRVVRLIFKKKGFGEELKKALDGVKVRDRSIADVDEAKKMLITLLESPGPNSVAYDLLVHAPKYLLDVTSGFLAFVILFIPSILMNIVSTDSFMKKYIDAVESGYFNYLQSSESKDQIDRLKELAK